MIREAFATVESEPKANETDSTTISEDFTTDVESIDIETLSLDGQVDLSCIKASPRAGKHLKANTAPLPTTRAWSPVMNSPPKHSKNQKYVPCVHQNFKSPSSGKANKPLHNLGAIIPTAAQYGQLTHQLETLMAMLPPEIGKGYP